MKIKTYLVEFKTAEIVLKMASDKLDESPNSKKAYNEFKKAEKEWESAFEKFANEFSEITHKERNTKFDLYVRTNLGKIEEVIGRI